MLLKTRREFTLCFFLFVPLGMAGYCAGETPAGASVPVAKSDASKSKARAAEKKGGQPAPQSPGGGLSSAEQLSRLLVDGRRAFRDGEIMTARSYFRDALKLDGDNPEAQRYLREIEQKSAGAQFSPDALSAQIPAGAAGLADKVDVVGTVEAVLANATPGPITQTMGTSEQKVSVKNSVSMALSGGSHSFSKPVSIAVSLDRNAAAAEAKDDDLKLAAAGNETPEKQAGEAAIAAQADAPLAKVSKPVKESATIAKSSKSELPASISRIERSANAEGSASARELLSEASLAVGADAEKPTVVASLDAPAAGAAAKLNLDVELNAHGADAAERAEAEKKASEKAAAASKVEEAKKAERARRLAERKAEEDKKAEEARKLAEKTAAEEKEAEEERRLAEKKAAEEKKAEEARRLAEKKAAEEKKAEEERKLAEKKAAEEKKAEEARKIAAAEKEAREAAEMAEQEKKLEKAKAEKAEFNKAVAETNDGIKLYNAGKYDDARKKFEAALATQPDYREAKSYLERSERKLAKPAVKAEDKAAAPVLDLDQLKDNLKEVAQASSKSKASSTEEKPGNQKPSGKAADTENAKAEEPKGKGDVEVAQAPSAATPAPAEASAPAAAPAPAEPATPADPIVEADRKLREAQKHLAEGRREEALRAAREAADLDPKNVSATALVAELSAEGDKTLPSLNNAAASTEAAVKVESDTVTESTSLDVAAPAPPEIGAGPDGVSSLLTEGRTKFESGQLREARTAFEAVLEKDPGNAEAKRYINKIDVARADGGPVPAPSVPGAPSIATAQTAQDAEAAFQQGLVAYQAGRLDVAVQHWNFSLTLDPNHPRSVQYLEQTRSEYEAWVQQHQYNAIELQKEVASTNKLETAVTYDSAGQKTLVEFLQAMSLITDINFYVADGVDADLRVTAKFDQTVLQDALDIVLLPVGLKWHRTGDVVTVTTDLHNKFYNLTPDQVTRLKPLLENRTLQRYLYGPEGIPPMRNVELLLDDRENLLVVTDSAENLHKIEAFLKDLQVDAPQQLVFKNWKIRPEEGQRIKALVEAIVKVNSDAAWDLDRRVVVDGDDLIVKDSADNVAKIEQLLLDKNFLRKLENQTLGVQTYSLIPREPIGPENVEQARDMAQSIVTVIKTILYSQSGEQAAAAEGRRFWYDPNTLQLTITDFPNNLEIVSDYLKSLPTLSASEQKSEIIWLKHQTAPEMKSLLDQVLGLAGGIGFGTGTGESVTKTLRTEGELTFHDLSIRVRRIEGPADNMGGGGGSQEERSVELIVRSATTSQDVTLQEFDTEFIDEYEITAEDIRPSGFDDGEGSVRLRVAINPAAVAGAGFGPGFGGVGAPGVGFGGAGIPGAGFGGAGFGGVGVGGVGAVPVAPAPTLGAAIGASISEEVRMIIETVPNMNALLLRYTNPSDLDEVKRWLKELDIPVLQVSIETKLVEVNETRAKEFMPELNMANLGQGGPDFGNNTNFFDFAKNDFVGEMGRSPFDPFPEDPFNYGLLKGTSVFNIVTGGASPISFTLRALESEGVVNMTNGPTVTVVNGEVAEFTIARDFGLVGATIGQQSDNIRVPRINHVNMSVTPQITQAGEIRLEITDLQLADFGNQISPIWPIVIGGGSGGGESTNVSWGFGDDQNPGGGTIAQNIGWGFSPPIPQASGGNVPFEVRRRTLTTTAIVRNHGTIVLGGWMGERSRTSDSGVPILRNLPYVGKLLFGRTSDKIDRTNLLIFLTCHLIDP